MFIIIEGVTYNSNVFMDGLIYIQQLEIEREPGKCTNLDLITSE